MGNILPQARTQFLDDMGRPLSNGVVYTFEQGTTTPKATYKDRALTIRNTNPVQLDASGGASIWGSGSYTIAVKNSVGSTVYSGDTMANEYDPTTVGITGGSIDGTVIGATNPTSGQFSQITGTGDLVVGGLSNVAGNATFQSTVFLNVPFRQIETTVAALPVVTIPGWRAFVSDGTSNVFMAAVVGGGTYHVPVHTGLGGSWLVG